MTEQDILELESRYTESKIQHTCVNWFRYTFPHVGDLLHAVPNGGWRGARAGAMMVYEGQVRGVADLNLSIQSGDKGSLKIEMKVPKRKGRSAGQQSEHQKAWQRLAEKYGNRYVVCHGLIEFITAVCEYLGLESEKYIEKALNEYPLYLR